MSKRIAVGAAALAAAVVLFLVLRPAHAPAPTGDPETRIVSYLKENVRPGQPVLVTDLYNKVFTKPEEQAALQRLFNQFIKIPASAAEMYQQTGRIPTLEELSRRFDFKVPGELDVMLHVLESDPRVPKFFDRDPSSGQITAIYVDRIAADERFGRPLRNQ